MDCRQELCPNWPGQGCLSGILECPTKEEFVCWKHDDCSSPDECSDNSIEAWRASHDTTACGGMQNGCSACAHIW